ncbi:MAG: hypothetical protein PWP23_466 [Candidatus Sumerlaeota bacterium]|nr:hypothetical protein [Candidatus Sumerlaeota bacterium]
MLAQPNDTACGPTCLQAVYRYYGDTITIEQIIRETPSVEGGGTIAAFLGVHALKRGYGAKLYSYNLNVFDPTWFNPTVADIGERLAARAKHKTGTKLRSAINAYREFLALGGEIRMEDLSSTLIRRYLKRDQPILTGLSATFLYRTPREYGPKDDYDDVRGDPSGHFVVLTGLDSETRQVTVADPISPNPTFCQNKYTVPLARVVTAILLGVMTFDANFLIIQPRRKVPPKSGTPPHPELTS